MKFKSPLLVAALMFVAQNILASVNIFIQPQSQSVAIGSNAVFTASTTTSGGETITGYTWLTSTNSSGPFSTIASATGPALTITNAQFSDSGFYFVRVNYQSGGNPGIAVSTAVTLSVQDQARITSQPVNLTRAVGASASFTVTAAGEAPLGFQWRLNGVNLPNNARITGANSGSLTVSSLTTNDAGNYDVIVTNSYSSATSQVAVLTILVAPTVTVQPTNTTALAGDTVTLSAAVAGSSPLGFRWKKGGVNLSNSGRFSGVTNTTLVITGTLTNDTGLYSLFITNSVGSVSSANATVTILAPPVFTSATNVFGRQGLSLAFKLSASGSSPITFGSEELPNGLSLNLTTGQISGVPIVSGIFTVTVFASNAASNTVGSVTFNLTTGVPGIMSSLVAQAKQGQPFSYSILASNNPVSFNAVGLPEGLSLDSANGSISGIPSVNGSFLITIEATNAYGADSKELALTVASGLPVITSVLVTNGQQGLPFEYTITASNGPVSFNTSELPGGLSLDPTNGIISGIPLGSGSFLITIDAMNPYGTDSQELALTIVTSAPLITSALNVNGQQWQPFSYTITATNNPLAFSVSELPFNMTFDPATAVISGFPVQTGLFPITITASNGYGIDEKILSLNLVTAAPVITSPLIASATEGNPFSYTILASNSPTSFSATGLPVGLVVDPDSGIISGTPAIGGTNDVVISARNAWGVGSNILQIRIGYLPINNLFITDLTWKYSKPYLLDFTFSLRDNPNPSVGRAVVRPVSQMQVVCKEGNLIQESFTPIGNETAFILSPGITINAKQLKTFLVMDYTYSMFIAPNAITGMESAVKDLITQEPPSAQFAVNEFHADFTAPALVSDFTTDKVLLHKAIDGIQTNFVKGNYAGSRLYDALSDAILKFGAANTDEQRYIVVTSDGYDVASTKTLTAVRNAAISAKVQIYCVGFGANPNTAVLQSLANATGGRYFTAASSSQIAAQFAVLLKDLNAQYFLRWATLQRGPAFQPAFDITVDGVTTSYNTNFLSEVVDDTDPQNLITNIVKIDTTRFPPTTNDPSVFAPDFLPSSFSNNVQIGELRLMADAPTNASAVTLQAFYIPRYVRQIKLRYRANYPCTPLLLSSGPGEFLAGWSLTETNDGTGTNGNWLTITSADPTNVLTSLPYGIKGDLVKFQFPPHAVVNPKQAFSLFAIDNSIYTNSPPLGQSFTLTNTNSFITVYPVPPPFGTPIPWLIANGFPNNFAAAELTDPNGNGLLVWQEYLAGLNPRDTNATLAITAIAPAQPGLPSQIVFRTVIGKTYRVDAAVELGEWVTLEDGINGTGGEVSVFDNRNLGGLATMYYRIAVY